MNLGPVRARLGAAHITLALGLLYAVGFVVANAHFGRYELPRIELLRARYLAASALFLYVLYDSIRDRPISVEGGENQFGQAVSDLQH